MPKSARLTSHIWTLGEIVFNRGVMNFIIKIEKIGKGYKCTKCNKSISYSEDIFYMVMGNSIEFYCDNCLTKIQETLNNLLNINKNKNA